MIAKKRVWLALILCMQVGSMFGIPRRSGNIDDELREVLLTPEQADRVVQEMEQVIRQARIYNEQNRAPRPDAAQPCDGVFPACNVFDLTELAECCCAIRNILCCLGASFFDV